MSRWTSTSTAPKMWPPCFSTCSSQSSFTPWSKNIFWMWVSEPLAQCLSFFSSGKSEMHICRHCSAPVWRRSHLSLHMNVRLKVPEASSCIVTSHYSFCFVKNALFASEFWKPVNSRSSIFLSCGEGNGYNLSSCSFTSPVSVSKLQARCWSSEEAKQEMILELLQLMFPAWDEED